MAVSMHKRGVELTLQTIVIAAILLVVAVVLIAIFTGKFSWFNVQISECSGDCRPACLENEAKIVGDCKAEEGETKICCKAVTKSE